MGTGRCSPSLIACLMFLTELMFQCSAIYNITLSTPLLKGQTLSSPRGVFELGFFSPSGSRNEFLGIWYKGSSPKQIVWVANREKPIKVSDASLALGTDGNLMISAGEGNAIWSTNTSSSARGFVAELSDQGNLELKDNVTGQPYWESFDHPGDTFLPGMTLTTNYMTGKAGGLTSWKSNLDPSPGDFVAEGIPQVLPEIFVKKNSKPYWRTGPWSRQKFIGVEIMSTMYTNVFFVEQDARTGTTKFFVQLYNQSFPLAYLRLAPEGSVRIMMKIQERWTRYWQEPDNRCDFYGACGPFGICRKYETPSCVCLKGYEPAPESSKGNWTAGCVRQRKFNCEISNTSTESRGRNKVDKFFPVPRVKLPYLYEYSSAASQPEDCRRTCLSNCTCLAYAFAEGIGCLMWPRELLDTVEFASTGQTLYLRVADTESDGGRTLIISLTAVSSAIFLGAVGLCYFRCKAKRKDTANKLESAKEEVWRSDDPEDGAPSDLHLFDFNTIQTATNHFSTENKLGHGGFGEVYKGKLPDGRDIAVKRLASNSRQGNKEFRNEVELISKLQHKNLVRLLGCCIYREEKLVIYEYMANKSLDSLLFDPIRKLALDWSTRLNIIQGIARGLIYLHRDSHLRVVHRDLKVSNILLDEKMNPKISDFGLARIFQESQDLANTHRVAGTLGYMSPEYAISGIFSEKSDVFSFGILLLEIVTGRRITSFAYKEQGCSLTAYAWKAWLEGVYIGDEALQEFGCSSQVGRCIHIALLCVQDLPSDRPTMPQVFSALNNEKVLPEPKQPAFVFQNTSNQHIQPLLESNYTVNEVTMTSMMAPR